MKQQGFTLVEIVVSLFLFSIIMLVVGSLFIQSLDLQRRALNLQQAEENASFVLESMTKELRVAKVVPEVADSNCPAAPEQKLTIEHPDHGTVSYYLTGTDLYREAGGTANIINSSAVQVTKLGFCISGGKSGDGKQTRVTILLGMQSVKSKEQAVVESQTTLSLRSLND